MNQFRWVANPRFFASAAAMFLLVLYTGVRALPVARTNINTFASYYTAAYILAHTPQQMPQVYDNEWFLSQIPVAGINGVRDLFGPHPPTMALLLLPWVWLPPNELRLVWALASILMLLAGLIVLARSLNLSSLWGLWVAPFCILYAPIRLNLGRGQVYLLLFPLLCVLFWAIVVPAPEQGQRRVSQAFQTSQIIGGIALGLALIFKMAFIWLWPFLLLAGRWRLLLWAGVTALAFALLSLPWIGLEAWYVFVSLVPTVTSDPTRLNTSVQTVTSLVGQLFVYDAVHNPTPVAPWPLVGQVLTLTIQVVTLIGTAALVRLNDTRHEIRALSLACAATLITANAPLGEGYHYTLALPSLLVAAWYAWRASLGWQAWGVLLVAALLLGAPLPYQSPQLEPGWLALLAYPRVYGAYLLWAWFGRMLLSTPKMKVSEAKLAS